MHTKGVTFSPLDLWSLCSLGLRPFPSCPLKETGFFFNGAAEIKQIDFNALRMQLSDWPFPPPRSCQAHTEIKLNKLFFHQPPPGCRLTGVYRADAVYRLHHSALCFYLGEAFTLFHSIFLQEISKGTEEELVPSFQHDRSSLVSRSVRRLPVGENTGRLGGASFLTSSN